MTHKPFISLPYQIENPSPWAEDNELICPESVIRHFIKEFSGKGDKVFDPFLGMGTTARVAEELGRVPYGIEPDRRRFEWSAGQLEHWNNIICGDSCKLSSYPLPKMDFIFTSPPYMPKHHKWNPLFAGNPAKAGYDTYLKTMKKIFGQLADLLKKNKYFVLQADNLEGKVYTPLVRDLGIAAESSFRLEGEVIVRWKNPKPDYPHTHCLIFKKV